MPTPNLTFIHSQIHELVPEGWEPETASGSAVSVDGSVHESAAGRRASPRLRIGAIAGVLVLYGVYRHLRAGAGRGVFSLGLPVEPFRHALTVLKVEHALGLDFEHGLQHLVLSSDLVIRLANGYYSWAHQAMTLALVAVVLLEAPWGHARRWVGALLLQLPVGLVLFRLYPLMPPRLLDAGAPWGGRILSMRRGLRPTGIVDTLVKVRGPWSSDPVSLNAFTNQFAAMPSLHCGFALWVGVVWWQWAKGKSWRFVGPLHTVAIVFCVVVTGNHFVLDALAGWTVALVTLGVTGRFAGLRHWARSIRENDRDDSHGGEHGDDAYGGEHGDNSRMPSTTAISQ